MKKVDKVQELEAMDLLLQKLYERVEEGRLSKEASVSFDQLIENEDLASIDSAEKEMYLEKVVKRGHARKSTGGTINYYISEEGVDFIQSQRSYLTDYQEALEHKKEKNVLIEMIALMVAIISLIFSYVAYHKINETEGVETRIEEVEKDMIEEENRSKTKHFLKDNSR